MLITLLCITGLLLSVYALVVERRLRDRDYVPLCDVSKSVSCSKAFASSYGRLFGIPNSAVGLAFYLLVLLMDLLGFTFAVQSLATIAALGSLYLAYLSFIRLRNFCVLCTAVYAVNLLLFLITVVVTLI